MTECKGIFWKARVNAYLSSHNSLETRKSLRILKRKSCSGCPQCEWFFDFFNEDEYETIINYMKDIKDGKIYTIKVHVTHGYYQLHPEVDNLEFIEVKE